MLDTYEEIFGTRAHSYQYAMDRWPDARAAEFRSVLDPLGDLVGRTVYDMPSGGGYLAAHLPSGARYLAVEPAPLFFDACPTGPNAARVQASIDAVPRSDRSADHIVSLAGLHHAPDLAPIFAEMRRLVRPGGRVVLSDVAAGSATARFLNGYVADHNPHGHDGRFLDARTPGLLDAAGLDVLEDRLTPVPWRFASRADAGAYAADLFGLVGRTASQVADALASIVGLADGAGGVILDWSLRRLVCTPRG